MNRIALRAREQIRNQHVSSWLVLALAVVFAACAGASIAPQVNNTPVSNNRPTTVYVYDFAVSGQDVTLNQGFLQKTFRDATDSEADQQQSQLDVAHQTQRRFPT